MRNLEFQLLYKCAWAAWAKSRKCVHLCESRWHAFFVQRIRVPCEFFTSTRKLLELSSFSIFSSSIQWSSVIDSGLCAIFIKCYPSILISSPRVKSCHHVLGNTVVSCISSRTIHYSMIHDVCFMLYNDYNCCVDCGSSECCNSLSLGYELSIWVVCWH